MTIPTDWVPVACDKRDGVQGIIYCTQNHGLMRKRFPGVDITTYVWVHDCATEPMRELQDIGCHMTAPKGLDVDEVKAMGWTVLYPSRNEFLVSRDSSGSGRDEDDRIISWSICPEDYRPEALQLIKSVEDRILGPLSDLTPERSKKVDGKWVGGTFFERTWRAENGVKGGRCYHLGTSYQKQPQTEAPTYGFKQRKGTDRDVEGLALRRDLLRAAAMVAVDGLRKGAPEVLEYTNSQAEFTNAARLGIDENTAFTAGQLNIAPSAERQAPDTNPDATDAEESSGEYLAEQQVDEVGSSRKRKRDVNDIHGDDVDDRSQHCRRLRPLPNRKGSHQRGEQPDVPVPRLVINDEDGRTKGNGRGQKRRRLNDGNISALGEFGDNHADTNDDPVPPTALMNLTKAHPDVKFKELFFLYEPKVCWVLEPHTSAQLRGTDSVALSALPKDTVRGINRVNQEMRNGGSSHNEPIVPSCVSATFVHDGRSTMEDRSYLNLIPRHLLMADLYAIRQGDPEVAWQIDRDKYLSAFSCLVNGVRTTASPWPLGPGWGPPEIGVNGDTGSDEEEVIEPDSVPYNNQARHEQATAWLGHVAKAARHIPLCVSVEATFPEEGVGGSPGARQKVISASRRDGGVFVEEEQDVGEDIEDEDEDDDEANRALTRKDKGKGRERDPAELSSSVVVPLGDVAGPSRPKFIEALGRDCLQELLRQVWHVIESEPDGANATTLASDLSPTGMNPLESLSTVNRGPSQQTAVTTRHQLGLRVDSLLTMMLMWAELSRMKRAAAMALDGRRAPSSWFEQLAAAIFKWLKVQGQDLELNLLDYLQAEQLRTDAIPITLSSSRLIFNANIAGLAIHKAGSVVESWLQFSGTALQASFVDRLLRLGGPGALVLEATSDVAQHLGRFNQHVLMVDRNKRAITMEPLDNTERDWLRRTPALQLGTPDNDILWDIEESSKALQSPEEVARYTSLLAMSRCHLNSSVVDAMWERCMVNSDTWKLAALVMKQTLEFQEEGTTRIPELDNYLKGRIPNRSPDHLNPFRALNPMTKLLYRYYGSPSQDPHDCAFWRASGLSELLTFHGFGQGWGTREGLALLKPPYFTLARATTAWTPFGPNADPTHMVCNVPVCNPNVWSHQPAGSYSLDRRDRHDRDRRLSMEEMLEPYWSDNIQSQWEDWLAGRDHSWQSFNLLLDGLRVPNLNSSSLGGLQLANSLALYGIVTPPSLFEMAVIIEKLNKGGVVGLESLGLCNPKAGLRDITLGLIIFHQHLRALLSPAQRRQIHFSPPQSEHPLCKVPRYVDLKVDWVSAHPDLVPSGWQVTKTQIAEALQLLDGCSHNFD
ncbi:hypothetical protein V5O48_015990 [Marasmius crinis-equi]|uniref:Uncharacterized protein n=1 Tax=Marasmius crinis-equi TaxID=585013 RepID=A0ABR3ET06_9AGAR